MSYRLRTLAVLTVAISSVACVGWAQGDAQKIGIDDVSRALTDSQWISFGGIALNKDISFVYQVQPKGEFFVEYNQRVLFFAQEDGKSVFVGAFQLRMNVGGRTYVLVYRQTTEDGRLSGVIFEDRYGKQWINLDNMTVNLSGWSGKFSYLGALNGATTPFRFESSDTLPESVARVPIFP